MKRKIAMFNYIDVFHENKFKKREPNTKVHAMVPPKQNSKTGKIIPKCQRTGEQLALERRGGVGAGGGNKCEET